MIHLTLRGISQKPWAPVCTSKWNSYVPNLTKANFDNKRASQQFKGARQLKLLLEGRTLPHPGVKSPTSKIILIQILEREEKNKTFHLASLEKQIHRNLRLSSRALKGKIRFKRISSLRQVQFDKNSQEPNCQSHTLRRWKNWERNLSLQCGSRPSDSPDKRLSQCLLVKWQMLPNSGNKTHLQAVSAYSSNLSSKKIACPAPR